VTRIGGGVYRVEISGRTETVYVAGSGNDRWAFCSGEVFHERAVRDESGVRPGVRDNVDALMAPMPATIVSVAVTPGSRVRRGDTLIVLEAMKMELPLRAHSDAVVKAVHCRAGDLVQPETVLIELDDQDTGS
jgi:acetyl/propionyl-CoA carboxylase alpha subunit